MAAAQVAAELFQPCGEAKARFHQDDYSFVAFVPAEYIMYLQEHSARASTSINSPYDRLGTAAIFHWRNSCSRIFHAHAIPHAGYG